MPNAVDDYSQTQEIVGGLHGVVCPECGSNDVRRVRKKERDTVTIDEYVEGKRPDSFGEWHIECRKCGYSRKEPATDTNEIKPWELETDSWSIDRREWTILYG